MENSKNSLLQWYAHNKRELPWRANRDPYRIWISETMLQQTTTTAVIPFFERFTERFPTLKSLAEAKVESVVEAWAGLGYYSRARNLHRSAQALQARGGFPRTFEELIELPGFGPYTARSVASLAFDQNVGVVDGNVIRVLARFYGAEWDWWQNKTRMEIQKLADLWVRDVSAYEMNQALMELGRTICAPKQVTCLMCPLRTDCVAFKSDRIGSIPKPKPRREREVWVWEPEVHRKNGKLLLERNSDISFLKGHWILPGEARQVKTKPAKFDYKHSITHHDIYVTLKNPRAKSSAQSKWVAHHEVRQYAPTSLVHKAIAHADSVRELHETVQEGGVALSRSEGRQRKRAGRSRR